MKVQAVLVGTIGVTGAVFLSACAGRIASTTAVRSDQPALAKALAGIEN
jgi:hypothetical protein